MKVFSLILAESLGRARGVAATAVAFAVMAASLPAIALAPQPQVLASAAVPLLWLVTLLAALLSLEALWHRPAHDGRLDILLLSGVPPLTLAVAVTAAHWLSSGLPLALAALVLGPMLQVTAGSLCVLAAALALGTVYLSLVGAVGALLSLGARQPGILMAVIVLPLMLPMLLLGQMAVIRADLVPSGPNPYLLLQLALAIVAAPALSALAAHVLRAHYSR
jgi:heme exporter protein B